MSTWGVILSTVGGVQYRGGYHPLKFEYRGGISWYMWGDIMSTMGVFSTVGYSNNKRFPSTVLNTPTVLMISPTCIMISPTVLNTPTVLKITPHGTHDIPHGTQDIPHIYHDFFTVLNTPHGTQDIPHGTPDIPHGTEHPLRYWAPPQYCTHIIQGVPAVNLTTRS